MEQSNFSGASTDGSTDAMGAGNGTGSATANSDASGAGNSSTSATAASADGAGFADRAREIAGSAQDKLADVGTAVRDRAGNLKTTVADALDSGADKLRHRVGSDGGQLAAATGGGTGIAALDDGRLAHAGDAVAGGMKATADWLRDADIDGMKAGLERQVKEHPGRTLLIAAGIGYLLGKALRK